MPSRAHWPLITALAAAMLLTGCSSIRQSLQNRPCVLEPDAPYDVITVDPQSHKISLYWLDPSSGQPFGTIKQLINWLETQKDSVIAITNGGIYKRDLAPLGLYIEQGQLLSSINLSDGYGNFYLKPNGVFYIAPHGPGIADASEFDALADSLEYAIQSGPLLLSDNEIHPAFTPGSHNCRLRSGIGITPGGTVHIAITNGAVNLYDFATFFRDSLGATDALYLDGAISTLYAPHLERTALSRTRYGAFLVVSQAR